MLRIGQVEATATQDGKYTDGSVAGGIAATRLRAAAFNAMQEELAHIVESAGLALDINDMTQVLKAIQKLTLSRANPFADIKSDGAAAISTALTNLGLGELSLAGTASGVIGLNGYVTIPLIISGSRRTLIIQWGQARFGGSGGEDAGYLNDFPFAFPSACYGMIVSHVGHTPSGAGILSASAITSNQFRGFSSIATAANAVLGRYIAIGV
ncbi:gp53-like domain-containing protein [Escherichia coli]|uniref:gp53-like domain-containing protein n=1 Tax=Escherichia coli TaxID=562 RepID=UPI00201A3E5E|nr:hypothetical protein [Escherichia coli]